VGAEAKEWRAKFEAIGVGRTEELEDAKRRLSAKLAEAEEQVEQALGKVASLEKTKQRLMCEMDDLSVDVDKAQASAQAMDKRQRQFDRLIEQWKEKCELAARELATSQMEARAFSAQVFKLKAELQDKDFSYTKMNNYIFEFKVIGLETKSTQT
jgi:chromosome segregation ATPase